MDRRAFLVNSVGTAVLGTAQGWAKNSSGGQNAGAQSSDAYARFDQPKATWTLGTSLVEARLRFSSGAYTLTHLLNRANGTLSVTPEQASEEFRIAVNGSAITGASPRWKWKGGRATVLSQGEIHLVVTLESDQLRVQKTYVVYPGSAIIRQWVVYQNLTSQPVRVSDPYFLALRLQPGEPDEVAFHYMTGGGAYTGSQILKTVEFPRSYSRIFDTTDKVERIELAGINAGAGALPYGSGVYMPWFCVRSANPQGGLFIGLDYYGRWAAVVGNQFGGPYYLGIRLGGYEKELAPGEAMETPKSFVGVFEGDLDHMGNELKEWQYRYLWDFTSPEYVTKIRYAAEMRLRPHTDDEDVEWGGGTQDNWDFRMAAAFHAIDVMRYVGADVLWQDAGWHDFLGDNDGPDFSLVTRYLRSYGMRFAVWWPVYYANGRSKIYQQHPDWSDSGSTAASPVTQDVTLNVSKPEVISFLKNQLSEKVAKWGDFQWRLDGTAVQPVDGNETPMLSQYHNLMGLERWFRKTYPQSSIDTCSGGGNLMGFEALRMSDVSQLTDGGVTYIGNYYSSYLFPPDKIDDWTRTSDFTWENGRTILTFAPNWMADRGLYGYHPGLLIHDGQENLRKTFELYHYFVREGVAGRGSHVFHPKVEGDDPVFYLERLSNDGNRGVIILKHFIKGQIRLYPKGLKAQQVYDLRFDVSKRVESRTGADLMARGIVITDPQPGELVFLGLPNHPGSGEDKIAPSKPLNVTKRLATNLGITGVELEWRPAKDNNWISHYAIYRDGQLIDRVSKGTYYFDHEHGPEEISSNYEIEAVDGDNNASGRVTADLVAGGSLIYTAGGGYLSGKDYSFQGANAWFYEEWSGERHLRMGWHGGRGHMGLYVGQAGGQEATVGASWMRPGDDADAVRIFVVPYSGELTITGRIHKDIYHTRGDGVRVKILKNSDQIWPGSGWELIAGNDTVGRAIQVNLAAEQGDRIRFIANCNVDATDDDIVWNPTIAYRSVPPLRRWRRRFVDDHSTEIQYTGRGWQHLGILPWCVSGNENGYLLGRRSGTVSISGTARDRMTFTFHGNGVEIVGDTGSNGGVATITLDGKEVASIDCFVPHGLPESGYAGTEQNYPKPPREVLDWLFLRTVRLWGTDGLSDGPHTLELTVTGTKTAASRGTYIGIDGLVVLSRHEDK